MIGDFFSFLLLLKIWLKISKLQKSNYSRCILEISIYCIALIVTIILEVVEASSGFISYIFYSELYPSILGKFTAAFIVIYSLVKIIIVSINTIYNKLQIENKIYDSTIYFLEFLQISEVQFYSIFRVFSLMNVFYLSVFIISYADLFSSSFWSRTYADYLFIDGKMFVGIDPMRNGVDIRYALIFDLITFILLIAISYIINKAKNKEAGKYLSEARIYAASFLLTFLIFGLFSRNIVGTLMKYIYFTNITDIFIIVAFIDYLLIKIAVYIYSKVFFVYKHEHGIGGYANKIRDLRSISVLEIDALLPGIYVINIAIVIMLSINICSLAVLYEDVEIKSKFLYEKEQMLVNAVEGNYIFKTKIRTALEFMRFNYPYYYRNIIENTEHIELSNKEVGGGAVAYADIRNNSIVFDPAFGEKVHNDSTNHLWVATVLLHEAQHLRENNLTMGKAGLNFDSIGAQLLKDNYFMVVCNPLIFSKYDYIYILEATRHTLSLGSGGYEGCTYLEQIKFYNMHRYKQLIN